LNIRKATLRYWREQFAIHLREQGVAANATERAVRGQYTSRKKDPIYRANRRAESTHERKEMLDLVNKSPTTIQRYRLGKEKLERTRSQVVAGWRAIADQLQVEGDFGWADKVRLFVARMPPPVTEQELLARKMLRESSVRERNPPERTR
jgi:type IV secretory pathway VirD2 relaxase